MTATPTDDGFLVLEPDVDLDELGIYLRVWGVLNPEGAAGLEPDEA